VEEGRLKQRLLGAMVLVALAVIFIPMLLSGSREMEMPVFGSNVPAEPVEITNIKQIDIEAFKQNDVKLKNPTSVPISEGVPEPEVIKDTTSKSIVDVIKDATLVKEEKKQTKQTKQSVYAVQVGSFNNRSNALGLKEKIRNKDMHAFVERIMKDNKPVYRVRVGPAITKQRAEKLKQKLEKELKLTGLIVNHP